MTRGMEITTHEITQEVKTRFINYLMETQNLTWLNDDVEREIYNLLFDILDKYIIANYFE